MIWIILGGVVVVVAIAMVIVGSRLPKSEDDPLEARLAEFAQRGEQVSLEDIELSQPFTERVIFPILRWFGELTSRTTPQSQIQNLQKKLELAGISGAIDAPMIMASRFVAAALFAVITFLVCTYTVMKQPFTYALLFSAIGGGIGFAFPGLYLDSRIQARQREVRKAMPDALDLLTICVEAGLGFEAAMSKVAEKWNNELSLAFGRAIREIQLGKPRREALRTMSDRIGIAEMSSFVAAVIQGQELGVSMAKILRIQSDQMRMKRRQRAEEEARQAPIKMLLPMVAFIFPSIFIVLMTPAAIRMMQSPLVRLGGK